MKTTVRLKRYAGPIDWNVGGLFTHDWFLLRLHDLCTNFLHIDLPIKYVFGGLFCAFHGGRSMMLRRTETDIADTVANYCKRGIGCRLTFSHFGIEKNELGDKTGNILLEILNEHVGNGVIVSSDILTEHIRSKYPRLQVISSLLKPTFETELGKTDTPQYYNSLLDRYDTVVVNTNRAYDDTFLAALSDTGRIELIANHTCVQNCPNSRLHYTLLHEIDALESAGKDETDATFAKKRKALNTVLAMCDRMHATHPLDHERLFTNDINRLVSRGVRHFKLEGRELGEMTITRDVGKWIFDPDTPYLSILRGIIADTKLSIARQSQTHSPATFKSI